MKCKNCGAEFEEGIFCPECGARYEVDAVSGENRKGDIGQEKGKVKVDENSSYNVSETSESNNEKNTLDMDLNKRYRKSVAKEKMNKEDQCKVKKKFPVFLSIPCIIIVGFITCGLGSFIMSIIRIKKYPEKKKSGIILLILSGLFVVLMIWGAMLPASNGGNKEQTKVMEAETGIVVDEENDNVVEEFITVENEIDDEKDTANEDESEANLTYSGTDGISSDYVTYGFQMNCDEIIDEFHRRGYESVWLESHKVEIGDENKKIGDPGTTDTVYLSATHTEEGYFTITEHYGVAYIYWGDSLGWVDSFSPRVEDPEFDFSGFNNTYWKFNKDRLRESKGIDHDLLLQTYSGILYDAEFDTTGLEDSEIYEQTEVYIYLNDFDKFQPKDGGVFDSLEPIGTIIVAGQGKNSTGTLYCIGYISEGEMKLSYDEYLQSWMMSLNVAVLNDKYKDIQGIDRWEKLSHTFTVSWYPIEEQGWLIPISKEEFGQVKSEEDNTKDSESVNKGTLIYGTYVYDDGESAICNAEVGFYTDEDGEDYINIECWGYGGHELTFFEGMLEPMEDGSFYSSFEDFGASIIVTFAEDGFYVEVTSSDDPDMNRIEGYYNLESELNLNEVG